MSSQRQHAARPAQQVGLDIGSSAVRAAEVKIGPKGLVLEHFAQVGLPAGAVVAGEIIDKAPVVAALRRLWSEGGFTSRQVVLAVSGQRVIVRQADVPAMPESDFRSALRYQVMDLIPIPVDDAVLDFEVLDRPTGGGAMRILLSATHREVVKNRLDVLRQASLRPRAAEPSPLAMLRIARSASLEAPGISALVDIGADLTVIVVHQGGEIRFSRAINVGGGSVADRAAQRLGLVAASVEGALRSPNLAATVTDTTDLDPLVSEIESSLGFFASQLAGEPITSVVVTGGASQNAGLVADLERRLPARVTVLDPFRNVDVDELFEDAASRLRASAVATVPMGAALWGTDALHRPNLVLPEAGSEAARRRQMVLAGAGVGVLALALAGATIARDQSVQHERSQAKSVASANVVLQRQVTALAPVSAVEGALQSRQAEVVKASSVDIAWSPLIEGVAAALPSSTQLTVVNASDSLAKSTGSTASTTTGAAASSLGTLTMTVAGTGGPDVVATWLRALGELPALADVWVPSATAGGGTVNFTSTASLTKAAPHIQRPSAQREGTS